MFSHKLGSGFVFALALSSAVAGTACTQDADDSTTGDESDLTTCFMGLGPSVGGAIEAKFLSLGGCRSFLGPILESERPTPDGVGRYAVFANGSIYWRQDTGANVVRGEIRERWRALGWEAGVLGYPLSDETLTPDGRGRFNTFEGGSVYWTMQTGAHDVRGAIRDKWRSLGWETGRLGYPTSDEYDVPEGRRSDFERGSVTWVRNNGRLNVTFL